MALQFGAGGGAYLVPTRIRCGGAVAGASAAPPGFTIARSRSMSLISRVPSSSFPSVPWVLCCSHDPLVHTERRDEAWEALKDMVADMFKPTLRSLSAIRSLRTIYDIEDYHVGVLFGAFLGCVGCYQLWKAAPSVLIDVALTYAFYKLSVLSSNVRRQGKCNDLFARLKFGIVVIMAFKDFRKNYELLDIVRMPVLVLYLSIFIFDMAGMKKYAKHYLILTANLLRIRGGLQELFRIMFYPGYVSPYDDCFRRK